MRHYLGWTVISTRTGKQNYELNNVLVGYLPKAIVAINLRQARWAKNTASTENYKVFAGKAEGVGWQNLSWREGTDYVQYWDGYERSKLEEFLLDLTGSDYCPGADCFEGQCTTAIHKNWQIS